MPIIPLKIRKHLIPFFFQEFEGIEACYQDKRVKAAQIHNKSSLGCLILNTLQTCKTTNPNEKFFVYLTIDQSEIDAKIYSNINGENIDLFVPEYVVEKINYILEDQFRIAFAFQIKGMMMVNPGLSIKDAISEFMVEYELDECGFEMESLRRLLNRSSEHKLSRIQNNASNRVKGF